MPESAAVSKAHRKFMVAKIVKATDEYRKKFYAKGPKFDAKTTALAKELVGIKGSLGCTFPRVVTLFELATGKKLSKAVEASGDDSVSYEAFVAVVPTDADFKSRYGHNYPLGKPCVRVHGPTRSKSDVNDTFWRLDGTRGNHLGMDKKASRPATRAEITRFVAARKPRWFDNFDIPGRPGRASASQS